MKQALASTVSVTHYKEIITILTNSAVPDKKRPSVNLYFDVKVGAVFFNKWKRFY